MRRATRAMLGVVLTTLCCGQLIAAESKKSWWPFGGKEEVAVPPVATAPPVATQTVPTSAPVTEPEATPWYASLPKPKMPTMPKMSWPEFGDEEVEAASSASVTPATPPDTTAATTTPITPVGPGRRPMRYGKAAHPKRNSWAQPESADTPTASPWDAVTAGAKRVGDSTAAAWHKTVDAVTPGDESAAPSNATVARQSPQKSEHSWWAWWQSDPEPEGPRTVTEWMAQERLDP